jgi:response regulator RpfG family c-di-GMP phosphodiesterase
MEPFVENRKVLYVDDEANLLSSFVSLMRKERCEIFTLQDSSKISDVLKEHGPFALVLSDQRMPAVDGVQVLDAVRQSSADSLRVLITGYADQNDTIRAINIGGIHSYVAKPWNDGELRRMVQEWASQYNLKSQNRWLVQSLDEENVKLNELLNGTIAQTARVLGDIVSNISPSIAALGTRVKKLGEAFLMMAPAISEEEKWEIRRALELFHLGIALLPAWVQATVAKNGLAGLSRPSVGSQCTQKYSAVCPCCADYRTSGKRVQWYGRAGCGCRERTGDSLRRPVAAYLDRFGDAKPRL